MNSTWSDMARSDTFKVASACCWSRDKHMSVSFQADCFSHIQCHCPICCRLKALQKRPASSQICSRDAGMADQAIIRLCWTPFLLSFHAWPRHPQVMQMSSDGLPSCDQESTHVGSLSHVGMLVQDCSQELVCLLQVFMTAFPQMHQQEGAV